ncbi:hypothetical protein [Nocardiopsis sp. RV163]|nr:hypothetical protein [Nocardiopsis sp. RV163]
MGGGAPAGSVWGVGHMLGPGGAGVRPGAQLAGFAFRAGLVR